MGPYCYLFYDKIKIDEVYIDLIMFNEPNPVKSVPLRILHSLDASQHKFENVERLVEAVANHSDFRDKAYSMVQTMVTKSEVTQQVKVTQHVFDRDFEKMFNLAGNRLVIYLKKIQHEAGKTCAYSFAEVTDTVVNLVHESNTNLSMFEKVVIFEYLSGPKCTFFPHEHFINDADLQSLLDASLNNLDEECNVSSVSHLLSVFDELQHGNQTFGTHADFLVAVKRSLQERAPVNKEIYEFLDSSNLRTLFTHKENFRVLFQYQPVPSKLLQLLIDTVSEFPKCTSFYDLQLKLTLLTERNTALHNQFKSMLTCRLWSLATHQQFLPLSLSIEDVDLDNILGAVEHQLPIGMLCIECLYQRGDRFKTYRALVCSMRDWYASPTEQKNSLLKWIFQPDCYLFRHKANFQLTFSDLDCLWERTEGGPYTLLHLQHLDFKRYVFNDMERLIEAVLHEHDHLVEKELQLQFPLSLLAHLQTDSRKFAPHLHGTITDLFHLLKAGGSPGLTLYHLDSLKCAEYPCATIAELITEVDLQQQTQKQIHQKVVKAFVSRDPEFRLTETAPRNMVRDEADAARLCWISLTGPYVLDYLKVNFYGFRSLQQLGLFLREMHVSKVAARKKQLKLEKEKVELAVVYEKNSAAFRFSNADSHTSKVDIKVDIEELPQMTSHLMRAYLESSQVLQIFKEIPPNYTTRVQLLVDELIHVSDTPLRAMYHLDYLACSQQLFDTMAECITAVRRCDQAFKKQQQTLLAYLSGNFF